MSTITTTLHLRAGTSEEYLVPVTASVSLFAGRYRIDRLETEGAAVIAPSDLDDAYEQIIEAARPKGLTDPARGERGATDWAIILAGGMTILLIAAIAWAIFNVLQLARREAQAPAASSPSPSPVLSFTPAEASSRAFAYSPNFFTTKHDNHWFVTAQQSQGLALLHHPDCPCGAKGFSNKLPPPE